MINRNLLRSGRQTSTFPTACTVRKLLRPDQPEGTGFVPRRRARHDEMVSEPDRSLAEPAPAKRAGAADQGAWQPCCKARARP